MYTVTPERLGDEIQRNWFERAYTIPYLVFPPTWQVAIIPPFGGADVRFKVKHKHATVSVYLDFDNRLGIWNGPYWEVYPFICDDGQDIRRCDLESTEELMGLIGQSLQEQNS